MVDSPREVVGAVLKYVGASYNTNNILQVDGVQQNLALLRNQVILELMLFHKLKGILSCMTM